MSVLSLHDHKVSADGSSLQQLRQAIAPQYYNDCAMNYNTMVSGLPTTLITSLFMFRPAIMFSTRDTGDIPGLPM